MGASFYFLSTCRYIDGYNKGTEENGSLIKRGCRVTGINGTEALFFTVEV
jgi:hypothetical protein